MNQGVHFWMILADLKKAFDTLDRTVLEMECIGFKESVI